MNSQGTKRLEELLKNIDLREFREFCTSLLVNKIGGPGSNLCISANLAAQRQSLLELLVHLDSVLLSGNSLLAPLCQIASQPQNVTVRHVLVSWRVIHVLPLLHAVNPDNIFSTSAHVRD